LFVVVVDVVVVVVVVVFMFLLFPCSCCCCCCSCFCSVPCRAGLRRHQIDLVSRSQEGLRATSQVFPACCRFSSLGICFLNTVKHETCYRLQVGRLYLLKVATLSQDQGKQTNQPLGHYPWEGHVNVPTSRDYIDMFLSSNPHGVDATCIFLFLLGQGHTTVTLPETFNPSSLRIVIGDQASAQPRVVFAAYRGAP